MKTTKGIMLILAVLAFASTVEAQTSFAAGSWSTYGVDNGDVPYDHPIMYASVNQDLPGGLRAGLWGCAGATGGRELDLLSAWTKKNLSVSVSYFIHAGGGSSDIVQVDLREARTVGNSEIYVMISPILPTNSSGDSGILTRVGASHRLKLGKVELVPSGWVMYDTGIFKSERGVTIRGQLEMPVKRGKVTVSPIARSSIPVNMESRKLRGDIGIRFSK
jgi:hypothetical protein